jgi:hypothetical protein
MMHVPEDDLFKLKHVESMQNNVTKSFRYIIVYFIELCLMINIIFY